VSAEIATWPDDKKDEKFSRALLSFSPLEDGIDLSGVAQKDRFLWVLELFEKI
jgi:hypothetical protein